MSAAPVISVVCTAFNHGRYIRETLQGFVDQRCAYPVEFIVHDDASTDDTATIIREFAERYPQLFVPIIQPQNVYSKGGRPWFICFERARGKYVAICEGDDVWTDPLKLQRQVDDMEQHPDRMLNFHDVGVIDDSGGLFSKVKRYSDMDWNGLVAGREEYDMHDLLRSSLCPTCSVVFRKPQPFNVPAWLLTLPFADQPLFIWLARNGTIRCLPGEMAAYRRHEASSSRTAAGTDRFAVGFIRMYARFFQELEGRYQGTIKAALSGKVKAMVHPELMADDVRKDLESVLPGHLASLLFQRRVQAIIGKLRRMVGAVVRSRS